MNEYETIENKILECIYPFVASSEHHIEPNCPYTPEWFGEYIQRVLESSEDDYLELYAERFDDYDYTQGTALITYGNPTVTAEFFLENHPYLEITVSSGDSKVWVQFDYEDIKRYNYPVVDALYSICLEKSQGGNLFKEYPR